MAFADGYNFPWIVSEDFNVVKFFPKIFGGYAQLQGTINAFSLAC